MQCGNRTGLVLVLTWSQLLRISALFSSWLGLSLGGFDYNTGSHIDYIEMPLMLDQINVQINLSFIDSELTGW